jgi:hypothetical protein
LLEPTHLFQIIVEGSAAAEVPHAIRFARRLAQDLGGVVVDQQTDEVWSRGVSRTAEKPKRDARVKVVGLAWYSPFNAVPPDAAARYLAVCRRHFPEAAPRRFGEYEPLQGKFDEVGADGFSAAWRSATSMLFIAPTAPCVDGSLHAGPSEKYPGPGWKLCLDLHHQPLALDGRWRAALERFFVALASEMNAFYATAEVTRGHIWNGRSMWSDGQTEWAISPLRARDGWMGLMPHPTWWAWYGGPYRPLVDGRLRGGTVELRQGGLLHQLEEVPSDRDSLIEHHRQWAPPELLAAVGHSEYGVQPVPLIRAAHIPEALRQP